MKLKYGIAPVALTALLLAGCESTSFGSGSGGSAESARMAQLEKELATLKTENSKLKSGMSSSTGTQRVAMNGDADLPPAKPGECYARILIPAKYETTTDKVVDVEAAERVEIVPARYEWTEERMLVAEASERLEVVPATYKTVTETVTVEPAREELRTIPAKYKSVTDRVLVREGYTAWKKGEGPIGGTLSGGTITDTRELATGEIMCLVEVPPEYRTVSKQVLVEAARTSKTTVPAVTKTVTKRIVATPATTRKVAIPAKYDNVRIRKQVAAATEKRIPIPATFKTVSKQKKVTEERLVWREVLCETNTTPDIIRKVQQALKREGFNIGADGILGPSTLRAIDAYQRRNNLGTGGLTMATVKQLGIM